MACLQESFLDEGFILDKKIGVGQPKRLENVKILVANTAMDTDKIKIYGARVRVDSMQKVADIEKAEREKMRSKVGNLHHFTETLNRVFRTYSYGLLSMVKVRIADINTSTCHSKAAITRIVE